MALALFGNVVRGLKTLDLSIYPSPYFAKALELSLISARLGYLQIQDDQAIIFLFQMQYLPN